MTEHFCDRLLEAVEAKGSPVCVGLDPVYERLPASLQAAGADSPARVKAIGAFCRQVLQAVAPIVPAVKPQIGYFEIYGGPGVALYFEMVALARSLGLIVIGDVKRGDIGSTAGAYATGHLLGDDLNVVPSRKLGAGYAHRADFPMVSEVRKAVKRELLDELHVAFHRRRSRGDLCRR